MQIQYLHDGWTMHEKDSQGVIAAAVPGSVYADLINSQAMPDPFWRDNEDMALQLMEKDYIYEIYFDVEKTVYESAEILLHCDGLDTIADVYLNGQLLGSVNNMHRIWEFSLKKWLKMADNHLVVYFHSPTKYVRERFAACVTLGSEHSLDGFPQIRKAHCMFGWDWGPRLPDAGIWRPIALYGIESARLKSVYLTQKHEQEQVTIQVVPDIECYKAVNIAYEVSITTPTGEITTYSDSPKEIVILNPMLWWPNGFGEQHLYEIRVKLLADGREEDSWSRRIGLRTMTVQRNKDQYGESFAHEVNGTAVFAMGADYIPEDNIYSRINRERTSNLLQQCKAANFNCIRVWGGGYYPDDYFFDLCDELGLIVWQDMMFACAVYELTDEFDDNIRQEIADNVIRIRHHASLGLWCGNNEMEMFVDQGTWVNTKKQVADYIKMYEYIIPQVLKKCDPETFYWPASPSSGGSFDYPNDPDRGDVHYWDVWHGDKPFSEYRKFYFRYASEFGFQSFPSAKTIESFTLPEDRNIFSYVMEKHQRNNAANGKIMNYMYQTFLYPTSFETLLYASQLLQAEAIKYGVEHFRRNRGRCMGAVYWQLNDCWPVASWASIDYYGRWKALHYYAKRFFAPVLLSCQEEGLLSQDTNVNAQPFELEKSVRFNVSNETMEQKHCMVHWAVRNQMADVFYEEKYELTVEPLSAVWLEKNMLPELNIYKEYISYELYEDGNLISDSTVILSLPKHFQYADPGLQAEVMGDVITITAQAYAKSVEILNENEDLILSDNYFDMNAGTRQVRILSGKADQIRVRSVFDIR